MPVTPTYPGVYIEELPSAVRTITAVTTSVTAFVGYTRRGPVDRAATVTSFADFERRFGGLDPESAVSYAVQQFFLNGGSTAVVVRVAAGAAAATLSLPGEGGAEVLSVTAKEPGAWGNGLRLQVDYDTPRPQESFNLRVSDATGSAREDFADLSMAPGDPRYVESVVNSGSLLVTVQRPEGATARPDPSGTVSREITGDFPDLNREVEVTIGGRAHTFTLYDPEADGAAPDGLARLALLLERKIRTGPSRAFSGARVHVVGSRLQAVSGASDPSAVLHYGGALAGELGLEGSARPTAYAPAEDGQGKDGTPGGPSDLAGDELAKTGMQALRDVTNVNLLCLPEVHTFAEPDMLFVLSRANELCEDERLFLIADSPRSWRTVNDARAGLPSFDPVRSDHAALYFPHIELLDPLTGQLRSFPPSGAIAGVMARVDAERGVWKAPAGTEARLNGTQALTTALTDPENGLLNPLGLNCLRSFPVVGPVVWGTRTLEGADTLGSQWKYVPVRRTALMVEESLYRGTKWVVFEPNDERLWSQIRLNVGGFMHTLFERGAFQGTSAREAYFVKCDSETTTQEDINRGVVNIVVGFAPLKPAEFVIVKIEQMSGRTEV